MRLVFQSKGMWNVRDVEDAQGRELGTELDSSIPCFFYLFSEFVDSFLRETDDDRSEITKQNTLS